MRNKGGPQIVRLGPIELKNVKLPIEIYKIIPSWQGVGVSEVRVGRNRVAVLPFAKISPDQADEYFAEGRTEDHLNDVEGQRTERDLPHILDAVQGQGDVDSRDRTGGERGDDPGGMRPQGGR